MSGRPDYEEQDSMGDRLTAGTSTSAGSAAATSVEQSLEMAALAITRLEQEQSESKKREPSPLAIAAVVAVCVLALAGIVVHTFYESEAPKVDETSALLLAVLLFAPFVPNLRALELGGAKAEFQEHASIGLVGVLAVVKAEHETIKGIYQSLNSLAQAPEVSPAVPPTPTDTAAPSVGELSPTPRLLRRILWVDDNPQGNAYELDTLRQDFDITTVTTTEEAESLLGSGDYDAVISDIVRKEGGQRNYYAGREIADFVKTLDPPLPVFFYGSGGAVRIQAQALTDAGAVVVTSSYVDLVRAIRRQAGTRELRHRAQRTP
jgi:CheY-like chemotaxis protein